MAYEGAYRCAVLTPTKELYVDDDIYFADVPGFAGHYGVVKGHESLVATNHQGGLLTLWLDPEGKNTRQFLIHRGCSQMLHDHLAILCRFGCPVEDIDPPVIRQKIERLTGEIEKMKKDLDLIEDEDKRAAAAAWIFTEEIHLSWYEAQILFAETGKESSKQ